MEQILKHKPVEQLEDADSRIKAYVILLEKKLGSCIAMDSLNNEVKRKLFDTQDELKALKIKMQDKENSQTIEQNQDTIKLKVDYTLLDIENKQLKQQIIMLKEEVQQLKAAWIIKTPDAAAVSNTKEVHQIQVNGVADVDPNANSILVKGLDEYHLVNNSKMNIINLGRAMNLKVCNKDVVKVTKMERKYYERHNLRPNKIILIVQLKTPDLKIEFLKNKEKLKTNLNYQGVEISDYVSDEVYNLYQYAKILKSCGYAQIFWRNNCVYAKKTRSTYCEPELIKTKADVDVLKNSKK